MMNKQLERLLDGGANGARVSLSDENKRGMTVYGKNKLPELVIAPASESAYSRTVRLHELLHARTSWKRKGKHRKASEKARQLAEDVRIHTLKWPNSDKRIARDAVALAYSDIRGCEPDSGSIYQAIRALAIEQQCCSRAGAKSTRRVSRQFCKLFGHSARIDVSDVIKLIGQDTYSNDKKALAILDRILDTQESIDRVNSGEPNEQSYEPGDQPGESPRQSNRMKIVELHRDASCELSRQIVRADSGSTIDVGAVVDAISSGIAKRIYRKRKLTAPQGTVVIDASGSMCPTPDEVAQLCSLLPAATIALYSGDGTGKGELRIVAKNGKRASVIPDTELYSNDIDDLAIQWLVTQPAPRRLLTDLQFTCPDCDRWVRMAIQLHESKRIELTIADSIRVLIGKFSPVR